jgi:hypothetical protein
LPSGRSKGCNLSQIEPIVTPDRGSPREERGRVVPFRPRSGLRKAWPLPLGQRPRDDSPVADLAKFERPETEADYRHRMKMNALGLAITCVLIVAGLWLAETMAEIRKVQDCVLTGRQNCAPIDAASALRH